MFKRNSSDFSSAWCPSTNEDGYPPDLGTYSSSSSSSAAVSHSTTPRSGWTEAKRPRSSCEDSFSNPCSESPSAFNADNGRLFSPVPLIAMTDRPVGVFSPVPFVATADPPVGAARPFPSIPHEESLIEIVQPPHGYGAPTLRRFDNPVSHAAPQQMVIDSSQSSLDQDDSDADVAQAQTSTSNKGERSGKQWRKDEDERLLKAILGWGPHKMWGRIAADVQSRDPKQCRERYQNYLDEHISNDPWTTEEIRKLIALRLKIKQNLIRNIPYKEQGELLGTPNGKHRSAKQVQNYFDTHIKEHMSVIMQQRVDGVLSISNDEAADRVLEAMRNAKSKKESPRESSKRAQAIRQSAERATQAGQPVPFHFGLKLTNQFFPCSLDEQTTVSERPSEISPSLDSTRLSFECLDGHQHIHSIQQPGCTSAFTSVSGHSNNGCRVRENLADRWNDPISPYPVAEGFLGGQEAVPQNPPSVNQSDRFFPKQDQEEQLSASLKAALELLMEE